MSLTQTQEAELIHLAQHGSSNASKEAINTLLKEHQPALYQYAMMALGDHSKAEQAVQNTLIYVWQALSDGKYTPNPESENPFRHWLLACCKNYNLQIKHGRMASDRIHYRERAKQRGHDKFTWASIGNIPSIEQIENRVSAEQDLETTQLLKQVDLLPKHYRRVFMMHSNGYTYKEIAHNTGLKQTVVRKYVHYSKQILKKQDQVKDELDKVIPSPFTSEPQALTETQLPSEPQNIAENNALT